MANMADLKPFIAKLANGRDLSVKEAETAFGVLMSENATPAQIGGFLIGLRVKGETVAEITGAAKVMRARAITLTAPNGAIDTCGTGGDGSGTYNISTAAAFITAACGVPVAKHGNRAASSKCGSADVLAALGVNLEAEMSLVERCLAEANICFMMAPRHHSATRHVTPARKELATHTIFNLLGPLANPAETRRQLIGVFDAKWCEPLATVLGHLGSTRAWVVHGAGGLDEVSTLGATRVSELKDGKVTSFEVTPEKLGFDRPDPDDLKGGDAAVNAAALKQVLANKPSAYTDMVILNAAAALVVADAAGNLETGINMARTALREGTAQRILEKLVEVTNRSV